MGSLNSWFHAESQAQDLVTAASQLLHMFLPGVPYQRNQLQQSSRSELPTLRTGSHTSWALHSTHHSSPDIYLQMLTPPSLQLLTCISTGKYGHAISEDLISDICSFGQQTSLFDFMGVNLYNVITTVQHIVAHIRTINSPKTTGTCASQA